MNLKLQPAPPTTALGFHRALCSERGRFGAPCRPRTNPPRTAAASPWAEAGRNPPEPHTCLLPTCPTPLCHSPSSSQEPAATPQLLHRFWTGRCPRICDITPRTCQSHQKHLHDKQKKIKVRFQFLTILFLSNPRSSSEQTFIGIAQSAADRFTFLLHGPKFNFAYHDITSSCYGNCYTTMH